MAWVWPKISLRKRLGVYISFTVNEADMPRASNLVYLARYEDEIVVKDRIQR